MSSSSRKDASGKRGGFTSLNLHQSYKGGRPESKGYSKSHGMQSLGRIGATSRRMPAPASLPSLRSENAGNDPTVSLVPSGGSGWKNKKEDKENKEVNSEVHQLCPEKPPKSPGKKFKTDFPSLEEQEAMSKRELEELERRHREEQELREREREEERERSPESGGGRSQGWRDPPPPRPPHGYHGPPPPPNMGPYPPRGPYPPHHYPPYMLPPPPPPGHGMPPYRGVPPMHGNPSGRYPPPHHMQFRPPFHHSGYPPPNPYEMDPYKMPSRKGDDVSRPPTVKADDLKSMDVPDEEEGGWAGHHEEVDYTKEVIFSDSSDDESSSKLGKATKKHEFEKPLSKDVSSNKEDTGAEPLEEQNQEKRRDSEKVASASSGKKHNRDKPRLPSHNGDYEGRNWGEQRPEGGGGWGDFGPDGNHPRQMPPYPFPQYPYPHPPPPPYGDPFAYAYQCPSGYSMPRGYPPPSQQRFAPQRGTKRGHSEREEAHGRHDFHPWTHDMDYRPKRKWSGDEERPRILSKSDSQKSVEGRSEGVSEQKEKSSALKRTDSASSDTQGKHHVTFADDVPDKSESPTDDQVSPTATTPVMMRDTKKIVMRKLGDSESDKQDQPTGTKGLAERPKDLKALQSGELKGIETSDSPESRTPDSATKVKQMAWNVNDRGPIMSPKTLYEPEGRRSEAKFNKYRRDAGELTRKGEKGGKSPGTPLSETEQLKEESIEQESQKEDDAVEKRAQTLEKEGGGKPVEKRIELKPSSSDRPRRRERDRERQDSRDKARHHRDDGRLHEEDRVEVAHEKNRERGRERSDHRKLDSFGRYSNQPDAGWERGDEKEGYRSREFRRGQDQNKDKPVRKDSHPATERREGEGRRDHYGDAKQQNAWKERHPSRSEPPRRDSKARREERRPREGQKRYENEPAPVEKNKGSCASEQVSSVSGNEKRAQGQVESSSTGIIENAYPHLQPLLPAEDGNSPKEPLDRKSEQKHSRDPKREADQISSKPSKGGQRGGDDQISLRSPRSVQRGEDDQSFSRPLRGRQRGGDQEQEGGDGGHSLREKDRDQSWPQRDKDRKQRPYGKQQPPRANRETSEREKEGRQSDRRTQQDTRSSEHGEKHDRHSGRQRDRHPLPQQKRHPPRGAERVQERGAASQSRFFEKTRGKHTGDGSEEIPGNSQHKAPEKARGTPVRHVESQADASKPAFGYGEVIDIESGSDWEEESFQDNQAKPTARKQLPRRRGERGGDVSASSAPPRTEQGERLQRNDRRQSREERGNPRQESGGRDFKRGGAGRGRGRVEDGRRERRGPEMARPGSYSSQRRQPSSASREESRDSSKQMERHVAAESAAVRIPCIESLDDLPVKSREKGGTQSEKKSESFHKSEFEKYDLNSLKVSIIDDIGGEFGEEAHLSPTAQAEFVQVTSKKTQKEKHKKEKEEQQKQDEEKRRHEEERNRRPRKSARPPDKPASSQSSSKPLMAWGTTNTSDPPTQPMFWGASSTVAANWSAPLLPAAFAAPGAQLKTTDLSSNWPEGAGSLKTNVGVIGDSLQSKGLLATPGGSELLGATAQLGGAYSLFGGGFVRSPLPPTMPTSSMLDAAVDSTMPGLSEDALRSTSSKDSLVRTAVGTSSGEKETQSTAASDETTGKEEGLEFQKVERSRGKGKSLPPRFQNSKPPLLPQPPQQQQQRTGRGRGERRGERKGDRSSGSSSNKSDKHTQGSGGSSDDRFYVHPRARGDSSRGGQKSGSSGGGGEKRHSQHNSKPPSKSGSEKPTKVVSGGGLEMSCDPSPDPTAVTPIATTGQQSPRAGSGSTSSELRTTSNEDRVNLGNCKTRSTQDSNVSPTDFTHPPNPPNPTSISHSPSEQGQPGHGSIRRDTCVDTEKNRSLLPRVPSLRYSKDNPSRPEGHVALHMQRSRLPPPSAKSISYADALKTKFTPSDLSTSNSTVSLRSQTPSESSSLLHHDVKDPLNLSVASSRCSTPAQVSSKQTSNLSPSMETKMTQGSESKSHSVQSNAPDSTTEAISVPQNVEEPKLTTEEQVVEELHPPSAETVVARTQVLSAGGRDHLTLVDQSEKHKSDIVCPAGNVQEPQLDKPTTSSVKGEDSSEAVDKNKVASEPHDVAVIKVEMAKADATPKPSHATTVSQTNQSDALSIEMPTVPQLLKAKQHNESNPSSPNLSLNSTHLQQGIFSESMLATSQSTSQPAIPQGPLSQSDNVNTQAGFQQPQVSVQQEEVLNHITPQPPSQLPTKQSMTTFYSAAEVCTKSFTSNSPQDSLSQSQLKQQYGGVLYSSPDAPPGSRLPLIRAPIPVPFPVSVQRPHTTVAALNQQQQQQAFTQHFINQHLHQLSDFALHQRQMKLAQLRAQAPHLNHPEVAHMKNLNTMVGLMPNDPHLKGYPVLVQRVVDTPHETISPHSGSVLGSYHKASSVLHHGVTPPGHVSEAHFIPSDPHPGVVYLRDTGGVVAIQQEQRTSQTPPDRDQRGESVESSKSGLSITATPFIPASETQTSVSTGLPIPPPRKVLSNPPEGPIASVPIVSVPQRFSHPPGFEGHLLPHVIFQQNLPVRAPPTLGVLPTTTPLIGHHPIPPPMAAAVPPIPVIPHQQLHLQRKSPLPTPVPSQPIQSTNAHPAAAAYQVVALQHFQRQSALQEQLPNHPKMTTLLQPESHIPHRRKLTHPLIGERASANAVAASLEMQAKRMPLSVRNPRAIKVQNPISLANSASKRPLLPTPTQSFVSPTSHVVSPGQSWQVRVPHAPPVQIPFPHEPQQRASSLYTYGTSGQY